MTAPLQWHVEEAIDFLSGTPPQNAEELERQLLKAERTLRAASRILIGLRPPAADCRLRAIRSNVDVRTRDVATHQSNVPSCRCFECGGRVGNT
jgi:hypothetical protein